MHLYVLLKQHGRWSNGSSELVVRRLCELIELEDKLVYDQGKPSFIDSNYFLSVSHSDKVMVIVIADQDIGIDIENDKPLNPDLIERLKLDVDYPLIDWCKREAAIKLHNDKEYLYKPIPKETHFKIVDVYDAYTCVIAGTKPLSEPKIFHLKEEAL
jgi:succinyl-CoA synthetase beta subunit